MISTANSALDPSQNRKDQRVQIVKDTVGLQERTVIVIDKKDLPKGSTLQLTGEVGWKQKTSDGYTKGPRYVGVRTDDGTTWWVDAAKLKTVD